MKYKGIWIITIQIPLYFQNLGREVYAKIKYILDDKFIGLTKGYVAFSIEILSIKN